MISMDFFAQSYIDRDQIPKAVPCQSLSAVKKVRLYLLILFLLYSSSVVYALICELKVDSYLMHNTYSFSGKLFLWRQLWPTRNRRKCSPAERKRNLLCENSASTISILRVVTRILLQDICNYFDDWNKKICSFGQD